MNSATLDTKDSISANDITITITAYPEPDVSIRGELFDMSEEEMVELEKKAERNVWAWSSVHVEASIRGYSSE